MIPLIAWAIVSSILDKDLSINRIFVYIFINPVYWYLLVQFVYEFIYFYCSKLRNKYLQIMCIICIGVGFAFVYKYIIACESIRQVLLYFPFYYGGLIISKHNEIKRPIDKVKWCSLFLYPISMIFYTWKDYTRVNEIITVMLQHMNVDSSAITKIIDMGMKGGYKIYNHYIVSPLGCAFYVCLAIIICCVSHDIYIRKVLAYIGKNTMYIYILHKYFVASMLKLTNSIILSTIMVVIICIIITTIVKKMEIIDAIFFGGKKLQER